MDQLFDQTVALEAVSLDVYSGRDDGPAAVMKEWVEAVPLVWVWLVQQQEPWNEYFEESACPELLLAG